ncbi:glutathione S-transferase N-terminal domain-containing protein [Labrys monachus]|uniref:Glutathione S-transferase n=1 Tax=Labrys monachus TaxID=217067 RepID=A0ABU0FNH8_9HYPH|nr:glutathione S-transferase N-terminal domain-containing protein [Labrys monachus]MDQ0396031.1 glutathione S-transferase [Labrys monachus]
MKLFYIPDTCALAVHIAALEAGLDVELVRVERRGRGHVFEGGDYAAVNPKGKVPAIEIDGEILTETQAILHCIASLAPERLPFPAGGLPRWRMVETLSFITAELHRGLSPLFHAEIAPDHKSVLLGVLRRNLGLLQDMIGEKPFLMGEAFTVADAYAYVVTGWAGSFDIDFRAWPVLDAYRDRIAARPSVQRALREEGMAAA